MSPNLDLLRSVAVLVVLLDHTLMTSGVAQHHKLIVALGGCGVLLFFVHTSLVLMMSLERLPFEGRKLFQTFYSRRFFRIYPLSTVTIVIVLLFSIPETSWTTFHSHTKADVLFNLLLTGNLTYTIPVSGPLWSLPYEIQMYVLLPFLFVLLRNDRSPRRQIVMWLCAIAAAMAQYALLATKFPGAGRLGLAEFTPCFIGGVIAYSRWRGPRRLPWLVFPVVLGSVTLLYAQLLYIGPHSTIGTDLVNRWAGWLMCLTVGLSVAACAESTHSVLNHLSHYIAKYSYGLYLGQVPVLWFVFIYLHNIPVLAQWVLFAALIVLVPVMSYHLIEEPFIRLGVRLSSRMGQKAPTPELTVRPVAG